MKISAATKYQKTSLSSTRSPWRGSSFSKVDSSLCSRCKLEEIRAARAKVCDRASSSGPASRGRFVEPMVGMVLAQRVKQGDGPAEDQVRRGGHPPGEVRGVGDPVAGVPPTSSGWSQERMP